MYSGSRHTGANRSYIVSSGILSPSTKSVFGSRLLNKDVMAQIIIEDFLPLDNKNSIERLVDDIKSKHAYFDDIDVGKVLIHIKKVKLQLFFKSQIDFFNKELHASNGSNTYSNTRIIESRSRRGKPVCRNFSITTIRLPENLSKVEYTDLLPISELEKITVLAERIWSSNIKLSKSDYEIILSNFDSFFLKQYFMDRIEELDERLKAYDEKFKNFRAKRVKGLKGKRESNSMYTSIQLNMRPVSIPMGGRNKRY